MADLKISELGALAGGDLVAADELAIVDDSASETKKITVSNLIANGVTLISDDAIPGAKILFGAGDIATAALADSAVTAAKIGLDAVTAPKIADNVIVNLVSTLPTSGDYTGQLALDTDDNNVYVWNGSAWLSIKAPGSVNAFTNTTAGVINISTAVSGGTATITASIDDTTSAAQFLAGPVGSAGTVGYRTIDGGDLPTATTTSKGGVIVNGGGLTLSTDTIQIANSVTASSVNHLVQYDANGLITAGSTIGSSDLPVATSSAKGAVFIGSGGGLTVNASGNLSVDNTVTSGTYTKVTVTAKGLVSAGTTLTDADIPDHSAAKLTSGTIGTSRIASDAITAAKLADQSTTKFGGAASSDNVTIFPDGDFQGQFFYDETTQDLYIYTGTAFVPITVLSGNLVNAGAYNANTNQMSSVTSAGSSAGFTTGNALPAPAVTNLNHYVVVDTSGTGSGAAPAVALAPPDMLLSQGVGTEYSLIDVSNAIAGQTASNISLIATGDIVATNVQAGITELDQEKLPKAGGTMTGDLNLGTSRNLVFEGSTANDFETTLTVTDPTADRTITLPNVTGTVVTTGDTGSVTSTMITDGTIVNADINASAEIAVSKLANGTARQLLQTDSGGSGVEFTSNVDVPGTLDVTNAATFDSTVAVTGLLSANGKLAYPAGSAAAVGLYSGSDTDTGIYSPGSNQFGVATAGTSRVVIDSSGRLLTGTSSGSGEPIAAFQGRPDAATDSGIVAITRSGTNPSGSIGELRFATGDDFNKYYGMIICQSDGTTSSTSLPGALRLQTTASGSTSPTERLRISSTGNIGIGTSSPYSVTAANNSLNIANTSSSAEINFLSSTTGFNALYFGDGATGTDRYRGYLEYAHNGDYMRFATATVERLRIDSSGNLNFQQEASSNYPEQKLKWSNDSTTTNGFYISQDTSRNGRIWHEQGLDIVFGTTNAERMRITSAGNLQFSNTNGTNITSITPGVAYRNLTLEGNLIRFGVGSGSATERMRVDSAGILQLGKTTDVTSSGTGLLMFPTGAPYYSANKSSSGNHNGIVFYSGSTYVGGLNYSDSATTLVESSDYRLKENIVAIPNAIARAKQLNPIQFNFIAVPDETTEGFLAHEVGEVVPLACFGKKDAVDEEGNIKPQSLSKVSLIPLLTAALKEAITKIEVLETKVAALEAR